MQYTIRKMHTNHILHKATHEIQHECFVAHLPMIIMIKGGLDCNLDQKPER